MSKFDEREKSFEKKLVPKKILYKKMHPCDFKNSVLNWDVIELILHFRDQFLIPVDPSKLKLTGPPFCVFKPPITMIPAPFYEFWGAEWMLLP